VKRLKSETPSSKIIYIKKQYKDNSHIILAYSTQTRMYYDELLETTINAQEESSVDYEMRQEKAAQELKKLDKYYQSYTIPHVHKKNGRWHKRLLIENYGSGPSGTYIRNAVTGERTTVKVGSRAEEQFFKVIDSTGKNGRREPLFLYYDSPEQYESHHMTTVSTPIKRNWNSKNRHYSSDEDDYF